MALDDNARSEAGAESGPVAQPEEPQSFSQAFSAAISNAGFAKVAPGEMPSGAALLDAVGGVRGLCESILPGLAFLGLYTTTKNLPISVLGPVALAVVFVVIRAVTRSPLTMAIAGALGIGLTALLALLTNKPEDNFLPGIIINVVSLVVLLVSLAVRWPLIGVFVGVLTGDITGWRQDKPKRRILTTATWLWVGLFALRLGVEYPLYLAQNTEVLAGAKLILGVPLYAAFLWITWLLVRTVFTRPGADAAAEASADPTEAPRGEA